MMNPTVTHDAPSFEYDYHLLEGVSLYSQWHLRNNETGQERFLQWLEDMEESLLVPLCQDRESVTALRKYLTLTNSYAQRWQGSLRIFFNVTCHSVILSLVCPAVTFPAHVLQEAVWIRKLEGLLLYPLGKELHILGTLRNPVKENDE